MDKKRKELADKLTDKQLAFCHEYIKHWNGAKACRTVGYAKDSARITASQLLTKPNIISYIEHVKDQVAENLGISKEWAIDKLRRISEANIGDVYSDWITLEEFQELKDLYPEVIEAIQEISTKTEQRKDGDEWVDVKYVRIKLYDKRLAIQDILKAMGWNAPEKVEHSGDVTIEGINYIKPEKSKE